MNNIFGGFGPGCNDRGYDNHCSGGIDTCWLIILMMLCGCHMDCIDPCMLILLLTCCGGNKHDGCGCGCGPNN